MRAPLVCAVAAALVAVAATPRSEATATEPVRAKKSPSPVLGISLRQPGGRLAWFDPLTLRMLPGRKAPLGGHYGSWTFSPDRTVFAISNCGDAESREIRFVNARAMRVLGDVRLALSADCTGSLTWLAPRRLLAVVHAAGHAAVVTVDPVARRVLHRESLPAFSLATGRTRDELVVLLGNHGSFAPARLVVAGADGKVRTVTVDRITAGSIEEGGDDEHRSRAIQPGLAVDPDGRRAFLVPHQGPVAEIDLRTLSISYHELGRRSLLTRLLSWLTPSAQAKVLEGPFRNAVWLGDGMIAVSGVDYSVTRAANAEPLMTEASAGVNLVNTRSWTSRVLDEEASGVAVGGGLVVAQGGGWDYRQKRGYGPGLRAFGLDGRERWRLHRGERRWLDPAGPLGYVQLSERSTEVVDLATGSVLATVRWDVKNPTIQQPQLLAAQSSNW